MRKFIFLLAFVSTLAHAQYYGGYLPKSGGTLTGSLGVNGDITATGTIGLAVPSGNNLTLTGGPSGSVPTIATTGTNLNVTMRLATQGTGPVQVVNQLQAQGGLAVTGSTTVSADENISGNVNVKGTLSSTANVQPASPTNSGIALGASPSWAIAGFYDQTATANNRTAQILGINSGMTFRFVNDAGTSPVNWLIASGGAGTGITGITSSSGTGSWVHTGNISATGSGTLPVYGNTGTAVNAPHMTQGKQALAGGTATVTFSGAAVFTSATSYVCTATDSSGSAGVMAAPVSGTSLTLSGNTTDTIAYQCVGN